MMSYHRSLRLPFLALISVSFAPTAWVEDLISSTTAPTSANNCPTALNNTELASHGLSHGQTTGVELFPNCNLYMEAFREGAAQAALRRDLQRKHFEPKGATITHPTPTVATPRCPIRIKQFGGVHTSSTNPCARNDRDPVYSGNTRPTQGIDDRDPTPTSGNTRPSGSAGLTDTTRNAVVDRDRDGPGNGPGQSNVRSGGTGTSAATRGSGQANAGAGANGSGQVNVRSNSGPTTSSVNASTGRTTSRTSTNRTEPRTGPQ